MDNDVSSLAESEDVPGFDVPDDALERAAGVTDDRAITWAYCTNWYRCWPH